MHPRLIIFDLDGTLAESKQQVEPAMGALIGRLLGEHIVAVMSGAGFEQFEKQFITALPPDAHLENLYIFPTNAAQCYRYQGGAWECVYNHTFTEEELGKINHALAEALVEVGLSEPPAQTWGPRIENRSNGQISFSPLGQQAPVAAKQEWHKVHDELRKRLRLAILARLPDYSVSMGGLTTIDITHQGINKAFGVRKLEEISKIPIQNMLYVGDALGEGGNDSIVKETGVVTHGVAGPEETAALIKTFL